MFRLDLVSDEFPQLGRHYRFGLRAKDLSPPLHDQQGVD